MADELEILRSALAGRYEVEREIGRGGMAGVYRARDVKHDRAVAIKVLDPALAAAIGSERFLREIRVSAQLQHPHILPLLDSGSAGPLSYYVMPLVEGESLRQRLVRERQLPLETAIAIAAEVAGAIDYAAARGVVHRDIKPENILLSDGHAMVADFGLARAVAQAGDARLTETGTVLGTPLYMSPEQASGSEPLDGRSDQYALGCTLHEMLAGQAPFTGPTSQSILHQHLNAAPRPVSDLRPSVPPATASAILRSLSKTPADRFANALEFARAAGAGATPQGLAAALVASPPGGPGAASSAATAPAMPATPGRSGAAGAPAPGATTAGATTTGATTAGGAPTSHAGSRRARVTIGVLLVLVLLAAGAWLSREPLRDLFAGGRGPAAHGKAWVLVADFESTPHDEATEKAARNLVEVALGQSTVIAPVSREQIGVALERAGRPDTARITRELARELAYRSSIKTIVAGEIQRIGESYAVTLRTVDADSGRTLLSFADRASGTSALIPCMQRLAQRVRREMGERASAIAATRPLYEIRTPSFEAYQEIVAAEEEARRGVDAGYVAHMRRALELDPGCASAWFGLGGVALDRGDADSARVFLEIALSKPGRLSPGDRLDVEGVLAVANNDPAGALEIYDRMVAADSSSAEAWSQRGFVLLQLGRPAEAATCNERGEALSPLGPYPALLWNHAAALMAAGDAEGARGMIGRVPPRLRTSLLVQVPLIDGRWSELDSLIGTMAPSIGQNDFVAGARICMLGGRGRLGDADAAAASLASPATTEPTRTNSVLYRQYLALLRGRPPAPLPEFVARGNSALARFIQGLHAMLESDVPLARRLLAEGRARPPAERTDTGELSQLLAARIALAESRPEDALAALLAPARVGFEPGARHPATQVMMRFTVAEAYEQAGRADSAASYYAAAIAPGGGTMLDWVYARAFLHPLLLRRLVLAELKSGQVDSARRHFGELLRTCDRPDTEMSRLLATTRLELLAAESARR